MVELLRDRPLTNLACKMHDTAAGELKSVQISPDGEVQSTRGMYIMDQAAADAIIAAFEGHKIDLVIDYEHQTLGDTYAAPDGKAPAAGWIKSLAYRPGEGLWGSVRWNEEARAFIRAGEYCYLSPVLIVDKSTRRPTALHSAGLTNKPAIPGMERLAASHGFFSSSDEETLTMADGPATSDTDAAQQPLIDRLKTALNYTGDSPVELLKAAVGKLLGVESGDQAALFTALLSKLEGGAEGDTQASSDHAAEVLGLTLQQNREAAREVEERLRPYVDRGVLNRDWPIQMESARHLAATDPERFEALMCRATPVTPPQGKTTPPPGWPGGPGGPGGHRRVSLIAEARRSFQQDAFAKKTTCEASYVNLTLKDAGLEPLSDTELQAHSIAKPTD